MTNSVGKVNGIQLLRAIAVMLVLHCHTLDFQVAIQSKCYQSTFFYLQNFGAVGVDLFFIISGFIITIVSLPYAEKRNERYFFIKRAIRVLPLYWLVSFLFVFISGINSGIWPNYKDILRSITLFPSPSFSSPILGVGWTLSFEMLFYSVITFAITLNNKKYILYTGLFFLISIIINYSLNHHIYPVNFFGNGLMLEFLMGIVIGRFYISALIVNIKTATLFIALGIVTLLITIFTGFGDISEMWTVFNGRLSLVRVLLWGMPCGFLVMGVTMLEKIRGLKVAAVWLAIGDASFSIYLVHRILQRYLYRGWNAFHLQDIVQGDLLMIISIIIVLLISWLFYKWVEVPLLRLLNQFISRFKHRAFFVKKPVQT